jgi:hypothetical protein
LVIVGQGIEHLVKLGLGETWCLWGYEEILGCLGMSCGDAAMVDVSETLPRWQLLVSQTAPASLGLLKARLPRLHWSTTKSCHGMPWFEDVAICQGEALGEGEGQSS